MINKQLEKNNKIYKLQNANEEQDKNLQDISSAQIHCRQRKALITILKSTETVTLIYCHSDPKQLMAQC